MLNRIFRSPPSVVATSVDCRVAVVRMLTELVVLEASR